MTDNEVEKKMTDLQKSSSQKQQKLRGILKKTGVR